MLGKPIEQGEIQSKAREQGFDSLEDIAYAEYGDDGKLYVYSKRRFRTEPVPSDERKKPDKSGFFPLL